VAGFGSPPEPLLESAATMSLGGRSDRDIVGIDDNHMI